MGEPTITGYWKNECLTSRLEVSTMNFSWYMSVAVTKIECRIFVTYVWKWCYHSQLLCCLVPVCYLFSLWMHHIPDTRMVNHVLVLSHVTRLFCNHLKKDYPRDKIHRVAFSACNQFTRSSDWNLTAKGT